MQSSMIDSDVMVARAFDLTRADRNVDRLAGRFSKFDSPSFRFDDALYYLTAARRMVNRGEDPRAIDMELSGAIGRFNAIQEDLIERGAF